MGAAHLSGRFLAFPSPMHSLHLPLPRHTSFCSANETVSLHGAQLSVRIESGDEQAAEAYVRKAWRFAQQDWSVGRAGERSTRLLGLLLFGVDSCLRRAVAFFGLNSVIWHGSPGCRRRRHKQQQPHPSPSHLPAHPAASATPTNGARGPAVQVVVRNASCATPACYTAATDESYSLTITKEDGIRIEAQALIGVSHALASLASLASPDADVSCLPIKGALADLSCGAAGRLGWRHSTAEICAPWLLHSCKPCCAGQQVLRADNNVFQCTLAAAALCPMLSHPRVAPARPPPPPPSCAVVDRPRFGHRGVLLDTARNWFSVEDIKKKVLDPMHLTKMNVLKW